MESFLPLRFPPARLKPPVSPFLAIRHSPAGSERTLSLLSRIKHLYSMRWTNHSFVVAPDASCLRRLSVHSLPVFPSEQNKVAFFSLLGNSQSDFKSALSTFFPLARIALPLSWKRDLRPPPI